MQFLDQEMAAHHGNPRMVDLLKMLRIMVAQNGHLMLAEEGPDSPGSSLSRKRNELQEVCSFALLSCFLLPPSHIVLCSPSLLLFPCAAASGGPIHWQLCQR